MLEADQKLYYIAKLEIRGVQATDKGEYRAVATNKHGESVATINLNFDSAAGGAPKWVNNNFLKRTHFQSNFILESRLASPHASPRNLRSSRMKIQLAKKCF